MLSGPQHPNDVGGHSQITVDLDHQVSTRRCGAGLDIDANETDLSQDEFYANQTVWDHYGLLQVVAAQELIAALSNDRYETRIVRV